MRPRTIASARASATERTPSRDSISGRSASRSSRGRTLTGVSLSNGRTATVSMWSGRPPPAKPYKQAAWARTTVSDSLTPNRRIESRNRINADDVQVERAVRSEVPICNLAVRRALNPLLQPVAVDELEAPEIPSDKSHPPARIPSNVGTQGVAVNANGGVRRRR